MKEDGVIKHSQWSHLPLKLSQKIMDRLYFGDKVRFLAVCKNWNAAQCKRKHTDSLPLVIKVKQTSIHMFECLLYEQSSQNLLNPVAVDKIYLDQFVSSYPLSCDSNIEISCKYDWLLFKIPDKDFRGVTFLYFSPLTKKSIVLPYLLYRVSSNCRSSFNVITAFSVEPNSTDCVFVALEYDCKNKSKHIISTFRHGENRWCITEYFGRNFSCDGCIAVYIGKIFYFVNACGEVAWYNTRDGDWKVEGVLGDNDIRGSYTRYLFELKGELMILYYDNYNQEHCCVRRLDWSKKVWVHQYSLGDQALFVSPNSFSVLAVGEEATTDGILPNKIYILDVLSCNIFSVESGEKVSCLNWNMYADGLETLKTFWLKPPDQFLNRKQPSRTNDDVVEDRRVVGQLKRSRSSPREPPAADVKQYGMAKRGKHGTNK